MLVESLEQIQIFILIIMLSLFIFYTTPIEAIIDRSGITLSSHTKRNT